MIDLLDKTVKPTVSEIGDYIGSDLFYALCDYASENLGAKSEVEYSGDNRLPGWNVKLFKSGKSLVRIYPREGRFAVLLVVGKKEKENVEARLAGMSCEFRNIYESTQEGMGQRWMIIDLGKRDALFEDVLTVMAIRRGAAAHKS